MHHGLFRYLVEKRKKKLAPSQTCPSYDHNIFFYIIMFSFGSAMAVRREMRALEQFVFG
jgi:hypothetical protein